MLRWTYQVIQSDFMRWRKKEEQLLPDETKRYKVHEPPPEAIWRERPGFPHFISDTRIQN
jgi:hypothetical protein